MKSKNQSNISYIGSNLLQNFIEQNPVSIQIHSLDGNLIDSNPAFAKIYALSDEALSELYEKYNVLEDEQAVNIGVMPYIERTFAGETVSFPEYEYNGLDTLKTLDVNKPVSRKCWVKTQGFPIKNEEGKITHAAFISEDISASKIAEKELYDSRLFTDNLIQSANVIIVGSDADGKPNIFNPAAERTSGYKFDEIKDKDWFSTLVPLEKFPEVHEEFNRLLEGGSPKLFENPILTKNGEERIISWTNNEIIRDKKTVGLISFGIDITEKKKAEEELKSMFDLSNDLIGIVDFKGFIKRINPAWESIIGYSPNEMLGKPIQDFIHAEDIQKTNDEVEKLVAGKKTIDFENRYVHKDGTARDISWTATPMVSEKNIYCIGRDITESKKHEEALIESEEKFRLLVEQSPYSIQIFNTDGHLDQVNESFKKLWGINEESLQDVLDNYNILEDEEAEKRGVKQGIQNAFNGESVVLPLIEYDASNTMEAMGSGLVANKRWVQVRFYPVKYDKGEVVKVISMEEDMTESMQAQLELRNSEEKYRNLVEHLNEGVIVIQDDKIKFINNVMCELTGYTETELIGKGFIDFINMDELPQVIEKYGERDSEDEWRPYETNLKLKNGISLDFEFNAAPTTYLQEPAIMVIARDISEQKKAENQILQYQQSLKDLAIELTYTEEKQRKQIATDLHDDVGQLLASARLQIAAVKPNMEKNDILGKMNDISQGLLKAIQATRNAIFELSPPQLNEIGLVAALSDWMEEEVEAKHGIETSLLGRDQIYAISEQVRYLLFRCVREMLINVIKHAKATQVSLNILDENEILYITVQDNGIGFDHRPDIVGIKHTGFGLFSIQERIKNIGGSMDVNTAPGKGTIITLNLPFNK